MIRITHSKVSAIADDTDHPEEVLPTDWNAAHVLTGTLDAAQMPALTGDVTTIAGSVATTLATVNSNTGSFGSSTAIPSVTVNAKGLVTAVSTNVVIAPAGTLTGATLASGVTASSLTSVGTLTGGSIGAGFTAIANARLANSSVTIGSTAVSLGATAATISGLTLASPTFSGTVAGNGTIPNAVLVNSSITIGSTAVSLGGTAASVAGLTLASPTFSGTVAGAGTIPNSVLVNSSVTVGTTSIALGASSTSVIGLTHLAVGTDSSSARVSISRNATSWTPVNSNVSLHIVGQDNPSGEVSLEMQTFGTDAVLNGSRANGTAASPTALAANDQMFTFTASGNDGSGATPQQGGNAAWYASQNWTATHHGSDFRFYGINDNTTALVPFLILRNQMAAFGKETSPQYGLTYSLNATAGITSPGSQNGLGLIGADSGGAMAVEIQTFSNTPLVNMYRANGTTASKTAITSGQQIGGVFASGYDGGAYRIAAGFYFQANQNYGSGTAAGTSILVETTADTTVSVRETARFWGSGGFSVATSATDPGAGNIQAKAIKFDGSSSGTLTLKPAAAAGTTTITLPGGTTDFSATGGTSQVVKQTSSGGAFTVAQLAFSDISGTASNGQLANSAVTIGSTSVSLGATAATVSGLTLASPTFSGTVAGNGTVPNAVLVNSSVTIGSTSVSLGATAATISGLTLASPTFSGTVAGAGTIPNTVLANSSVTYGTTAVALGASSTSIAGLTSVGLTSGSTINVNSDTYLGRAAAANWMLGQADAASPVAQTLSVQNVVGGTSNTAGANFTLKGSIGTGTGAGGDIIIQVAPAGSSGTSQNSLVTRGTFKGSGKIGLGTETNPQADFVFSRNAATGITNGINSNALNYIGLDTSSAAIINVMSFAGAPGLWGQRANGTAASPTRVVSGNTVFSFFAGGYDGTNYDVGTAGMSAVATEDYVTSPGLQLGTKFTITTTATGGVTGHSFVFNASGGFGVDTTSDPGAGMIYTNSATFMNRTKTSWSTGAGAGAGTITNAPSVGNPTKWIPVDDNGTTRYIPAW